MVLESENSTLSGASPCHPKQYIHDPELLGAQAWHTGETPHNYTQCLRAIENWDQNHLEKEEPRLRLERSLGTERLKKREPSQRRAPQTLEHTRSRGLVQIMFRSSKSCSGLGRLCNGKIGQGCPGVPGQIHKQYYNILISYCNSTLTYEYLDATI